MVTLGKSQCFSLIQESLFGHASSPTRVVVCHASNTLGNDVHAASGRTASSFASMLSKRGGCAVRHSRGM